MSFCQGRSTVSLRQNLSPLPFMPDCVDNMAKITGPAPNRSRVHSRHRRHMADLPWADVAVATDLQVRRFFCLAEGCPRVFFCERLPGVVAPWGRRT